MRQAAIGFLTGVGATSVIGAVAAGADGGVWIAAVVVASAILVVLSAAAE